MGVPSIWKEIFGHIRDDLLKLVRDGLEQRVEEEVVGGRSGGGFHYQWEFGGYYGER